ncbi:hypothetical protein R4K48_11940 [Brachyspira pulli]|uniref:hypothetical protein n=1 Tax=Brachyspira pulli TaxID=310721 RepID=UPI00300479E1
MKEQTLTQGKILKSLISFAFPILLALFLQAMYGAADLIIVGSLQELMNSLELLQAVNYSI